MCALRRRLLLTINACSTTHLTLLLVEGLESGLHVLCYLVYLSIYVFYHMYVILYLTSL